MRSHLLLVAAAFFVLGIVDLALSLRAGDSIAAVLSAAPAVLGVWLLLAVAGVCAATVAGRLADGRDWPVATAVRARGVLRRWWEERGTIEDRRRVARLGIALVSFGVFSASSVAIIRTTIAPRNHPTLVSVASFTVVVGVALATLFVAWSIERRVIRERPWTTRLPGVDTFTAGAVALVAAITLAAATLWVYRDVYLAVEGPALTMFSLAFVVLTTSPLAIDTPSRRWVALLLFVSSIIGLSTLNLGSDGRRQANRAPTARIVIAALNHLSDVDRDGVSSFPIARDCAPFDASRNPLAAEVPGNDVDENCDGLDRIDAYTLPPREHERWTERRPNIVFVTFDATRADRVGFMGHERDTTPNLDRLAERGAVFEWAFSQDSGTGPSIWSLFAGKTPFQVSLYNGHRFPPYIAEEERLLGDFLSDAGYKNYAVLCGTLFDREYWTLKRGFVHWKNVCGKRQRRTAPLVTRAATALLGDLTERDPFFLWLHYFDPHHPYDGHDRPYGSDVIDRYDAEIRYTDEHFATFWRAFERKNFQRPTYIVFSADHGEAFGEHGDSHHARTLYREVTHVPLFIMGPGIDPQRIETPVALSDLFPTFLELAQAEVPTESTMVSLAPASFGGARLDPRRPVFQENSYSRPRRHAKAVIRGQYHLIRDVTNDVDELYDYRDDPLESENLRDRLPDVYGELRREIDAFITTTRIPEGMR